MERRRVLAAAAVGGALVGLGPLLSACTSSASRTGTASGPPATTDPDARTRAAAVESGLVAAAEAVLARWPTTRSVVLPVRDGHAAHVVALVGSTSPSPSATGAAGSTPTQTVGSTRSAALRDLAGLERGAARAHAVGAQPAAPADARLIASIGGFAAAQAVVLARAAG